MAMQERRDPAPTDARATSWELLRLAREGDRDALDALFARHMPLLRRWARGRLPKWARSITDTADLVQDALLNTFRRIDAFDVRRKGALQAYLRQAVQNRIRDEFRSFSRRPAHDPIDVQPEDPQASPYALAVDAETSARYTRALQQLSAADRELIVGRIELGYSYEQLAVVAGRPTAESARLAVRRALLKLADEMGRG
jgi:RNA polymerase sigma factor (sigma-70 family)